MKLDFLSSGKKPDRIYEKPLVRTVSVDKEGLLCVSTTIKDFDEEKFDW